MFQWIFKCVYMYGCTIVQRSYAMQHYIQYYCKYTVQYYSHVCRNGEGADFVVDERWRNFNALNRSVRFSRLCKIHVHLVLFTSWMIDSSDVTRCVKLHPPSSGSSDEGMTFFFRGRMSFQAGTFSGGGGGSRGQSRVCVMSTGWGWRWERPLSRNVSLAFA